MTLQDYWPGPTQWLTQHLSYRHLHRLPIKFGIDFPVLTYRTLHGQAPDYWLQPYITIVSTDAVFFSTVVACFIVSL